MKISMLSTAMLIAASSVSNAQVPATGVASPALPALRLMCRGTGDHAVHHTNSGFAWGRHGSASAIGTSAEQVQFEDRMDIDLSKGAAKARVPRRFLPQLHGSDGGWFGIKDLVVSDDVITGMVMINGFNHPKMRIDRRDGFVSLDGKVGSYAGECQPFDPASEKRAF